MFCGRGGFRTFVLHVAVSIVLNCFTHGGNEYTGAGGRLQEDPSLSRRPRVEARAGVKGDSPIAALRGLYPRQGRYGCFKPSMIACSLRVDVAVCSFALVCKPSWARRPSFGGCSSYSDCSDGKQNVRKRKTNKPLLIRLCLTLQRVSARGM